MRNAVATFTRTERLLLSVQLVTAASVLWIAELLWSIKHGQPRHRSASRYR